MEVHAHVERGTFAEFLRAESSCPLAVLLPQSLSSWDDGHMSLPLAERSCPCLPALHLHFGSQDILLGVLLGASIQVAMACIEPVLFLRELVPGCLTWPGGH